MKTVTFFRHSTRGQGPQAGACFKFRMSSHFGPGGVGWRSGCSPLLTGAYPSTNGLLRQNYVQEFQMRQAWNLRLFSYARSLHPHPTLTPYAERWSGVLGVAAMTPRGWKARVPRMVSGSQVMRGFVGPSEGKGSLSKLAAVTRGASSSRESSTFSGRSGYRGACGLRSSSASLLYLWVYELCPSVSQAAHQAHFPDIIWCHLSKTECLEIII